MSFINDIKTEISQASDCYDNKIAKLVLFESSVINNHVIRQKEIFLESYRNDDFGNCEYLFESENESLVEKTRRTINKMFEVLKDFIDKCKNKIVETFTKIKETGLIKKLDDAQKQEPEISKIQVEYEDVTAAEKEIEKEYEEAKQRTVDIANGKIDENTINAIEEQEQRVQSKFGKKAKIVVITTVTIASLIAVAKMFISHSGNDNILKDVQKTKELVNSKKFEKFFLNLSPEKRAKFNMKTDAYDIKRINRMANGKTINFLGEANYTKILMKQITIQNNLAKLSEKLQIEKLTNITSGLKSGASKVGDFFKSAGNAVKSAAGGAKKVVKGTKAVNRTGKKIQNGVNAVKSKASRIFGTVGESTDIDNCYSDLYSDIFGEKYDSSSEINDIDTMYSEFCNDILYNF